MSIVKGLKNVEAVVNKKTYQSDPDAPRTRWLRLEEGQSVKVRTCMSSMLSGARAAASSAALSSVRRLQRARWSDVSEVSSVAIPLTAASPNPSVSGGAAAPPAIL